MKFSRLISGENYKGTKNYIKTQTYYEIARTIIYFGISIAILVGGIITTKTKRNLLTVVAVLGFLPASKSLVNSIMFLRYKSLSEDKAGLIEEHAGSLCVLYDCVFTSYKQNFNIGHLVIKGNTVCGFCESEKFDEKAFYEHIDQILKNDNLKNVNVKIFTDINKYTERLDSMNASAEESEDRTLSVMSTLLSVVL
ncbi:MAG: hypothetical protein K6D96_00625 [Acetatifactor sp.]|nr:hypothetical protein [Acetatifactor sp.]